MSHQVLARKWRPRNFAAMVGQEHVVRALANALAQNRLHHAYLFTGTRGVGKTTLARILAKALNCEAGITAEPCGQCPPCREIDAGRFVDLLELDAASNTGVDNMREVLDNAQYAPTAGRFKVYVIDEVHMLSRSAFNSMLKTLEEPPEHVKFILATTDPQKIPVTVLSRCLQFNLKHLSAPLINGQLRTILDAEGMAFQPAALNLLSRSAQGSMRDALSLLDQAIAYSGGHVDEDTVRQMLGAVDQSYLFALLEALAATDGAALMAQADQLQTRSLSLESALQDLAGLLHRMALAQRIPEALDGEDPDTPRILALAQHFDAETLQLYYQIALHGRRDLALAPDEFAGFSMTLLRMLAFAPATPATQTLTPAAPPPAYPRPPAAPEPAAAPEPPARPAISAAPPVVPTGGSRRTFAGDWPALVAELRLGGGMALMLAQQCELVAHDGHVWQLRIPEQHKGLTGKNYQEKLRAALGEHFGQEQTLNIECGVTRGETPFARQQQQRTERQNQAVAAIEQDPLVQTLVDTFDGRILPASIHPIGD